MWLEINAFVGKEFIVEVMFDRAPRDSLRWILGGTPIVALEVYPLIC